MQHLSLKSVCSLLDFQDSPNTAQIEKEHTEAEQRRQKLLIDRQQVIISHLQLFI